MHVHLSSCVCVRACVGVCVFACVLASVCTCVFYEYARLIKVREWLFCVYVCVCARVSVRGRAHVRLSGIKSMKASTQATNDPVSVSVSVCACLFLRAGVRAFERLNLCKCVVCKTENGLRRSENGL